MSLIDKMKQLQLLDNTDRLKCLSKQKHLNLLLIMLESL